MTAEDVTLTLQCDNACPFCPQPHHDKLFLPHPEVDRLLREVRAAGDSIVLTGGEPTLHPEFFAVVDHCRQLGFRHIGIVTNGRGCADLSFARRLLDSGVNSVALSIHSHREAVHDEMSGATGAWSQTWRGLANLLTLNERLGLGESVRTNTVFGPLNGPEILDTVRRLSRLGVRTLFLLDTISQDGGQDIVDYSIVAESYRALSEDPAFRGLHIRFRGFPACVFGRRPNEIEVDRGYPLPSRNQARLFWEPIRMRTMPDSDARQLGRYVRGMENRFSYDTPHCGPCTLRGRCNGVQKDYLAHHRLTGIRGGFGTP